MAFRETKCKNNNNNCIQNQLVLQSNILKNNGRERKLIKLHTINGEIKES
jgi:hypothetical protein